MLKKQNEQMRDAAREGHAEAKKTRPNDDMTPYDAAREGHAEAKSVRPGVAGCGAATQPARATLRQRRNLVPMAYPMHLTQPARATLRQRVNILLNRPETVDAAREGHAEAKACELSVWLLCRRRSPRGLR